MNARFSLIAKAAKNRKIVEKVTSSPKGNVAQMFWVHAAAGKKLGTREPKRPTA
jgi:hypothetical protein